MISNPAGQLVGSSKHKTVAQIAAEVALERGRARQCNYCVAWGDPETLDEIAKRATHTTILQERDEPVMHRRILNALDNSSLFVKHYIKLRTRCRIFYLKDHVPDLTVWR